MFNLQSQVMFLIFIELGHFLKSRRGLSGQCALLQDGSVFFEMVLLCKLFHLLVEIFLGDTSENIDDPPFGIVGQVKLLMLVQDGSFDVFAVTGLDFISGKTFLSCTATKRWGDDGLLLCQ